MNRSLLFFFAAVLILLSMSSVRGQDFPMLRYTVENGLPGNTVYSVYRDSKGYIWIATNKGIARYNGVKFEHFSSFNGLPDNEVFFVREDGYGRIWLGTFNGSLCYYREGIFHTATNTPFLKIPFVNIHIKHVSLEKDSSIIISYRDPSKFLVIDNESAKIFDLAKINDTAILKSVVFGKKLSANRYKLICRDKIVIIDTLYRILEVSKADERFISRGDFTSCQNQDYLFNDKYVFTMDRELVSALPGGFTKTNQLHQIYIEGRNIYYATNNGLFINDSLHILKTENVSAITRDGQNNFWVSSLNNNDGIFILKKDYLNSKLYSNAYKGAVKYAFARDKNLFFTTTDNSLFQLRNGKVSCLFNYAGYKHKPYDYPVDFGFYIDSSYRYYNIYRDDFTVIENLLQPHAKTRPANIFFRGTKEMLYSGSYLYLKLPYYLTRVNTKSKNDDLVPQVINNRGQERIFGVAKAPDNGIWYSTINSMYRIENDLDSGVLQPQFNNVHLKYFGFFGKYLIGYTHDNRLLICEDINSPKMMVDSVSPLSRIWDKLYKIDSANILASTNNLYRLLTIHGGGAQDKFSVMPIEDPFLPLHADAICTDGDDLYFFKNGSITVLDFKTILKKSDPPGIFFTSLKTAKTTYPVSTEMELSFKESRTMTVSFSTVSFGGKEVRYQYCVSRNGGESWLDLSGDEINLVNSGYGNIIIKLKAKTLSSAYSEPIVLAVHILRPYWATWWFIIIACFVLTMITGLAIRLRILYVLRKKEKEHDTKIMFMKSEYKALNALMNPHFIFNTLNNVQGLVNRNDKLAANEYIRIFADLVRQNMHNISRELIPLQKEIDLVSNYLLLEKLRFKDHLNYRIEVEEGVDLSGIMIPPLLVQPLVENSIKHGILPLETANGFIEINLYERDDTLFIEVKDNGTGMGMHKNQTGSLHESFALGNIRKRIEHMSIIQDKQISFNIGEVTDNNGKLQWTVVTIGIPIS